MFTPEEYVKRKEKGYVVLLSKDKVRFSFLDPLMGDIEETYEETILLTDMEDYRADLLYDLADVDALIADLKALGA